MNTRVTLLTGILMASVLVGCATKRPETAIRKVQMYHLKSIRSPATQDMMIRSETKKRMWGAISPSERRERLGNYYAVHWKTKDSTLPATVRLQYRQANSGTTLRTQEVTVPVPKGKNVTKFQIIGPAYQQEGRVASWRITVEQGGLIIGEETSFLWN